jgi:hypothetical protein
MNQIQKQTKQIRRDTMKVTMTTLMAGPDGVAGRGTVLDLPQDQAEQLIRSRQARPYDRERDKKAPVGKVVAPVQFER